MYVRPVGTLGGEMLKGFITVAVGEFAVALYSYWERTEYIETNSLNTELTFRVVVEEIREVGIAKTDVRELADLADLLLGRSAFFGV